MRTGCEGQLKNKAGEFCMDSLSRLNLLFSFSPYIGFTDKNIEHPLPQPLTGL